MRRHVVVALATASAVLASVTPAFGQSWRADIGVNGGGSFYTSLLSNDQFGGSGDAVKFAPSWLVGGQLGFWFTPRIGIRANMTYTDTKLKQGSNEIFPDINLWSGTGDLLFRLKTPAATFTKMEALPYIALGAGAKWVDPAGEAFSLNTGENGIPFTCSGGVCSGPTALMAAGSSNFFLAETPRFMGLVGIGSDFRLARNFALRLEAGDRIYKPKVFALSTGVGPFPFVNTNTGTTVGKLVNEIYGQLGLHLLLGVAAPPVVAVTPTPAPPPPAAPTPPPAPTTTTAAVCVVNPAAPTGLVMDTVTINTTTNDTTVMINGTATPIRTAFTAVPVAATAPWYVQGQPLTLGTGRTAVAYVSFGTARNVAPEDLTYLGTVNGLPVYASRTDVATLTIPSPPGEIGTNAALVTGLRNVQVLYVPVSPYGCNFQPVQLQQAVRKVRG